MVIFVILVNSSIYLSYALVMCEVFAGMIQVHARRARNDKKDKQEQL